MNSKDKSNRKSKSRKPKHSEPKAVRLQEYLDSLIELHKLQAVLLNHMDKEVK